MSPVDGGPATERRYRPDTLILESVWETAGGRVRVIDFMPQRDQAPDIVRIVEGLDGTVEMTTELVIRFDYGSVVPWLRRIDDDTLVAVGGPDGLALRTPVDLEPDGMKHTANFGCDAGERVPFVLTWFPSHHRPPQPVDAERALEETEAHWLKWFESCAYHGRVPGGSPRLAGRAQGAHLRADGRDRGGADDVPAGAPGRSPQLGLSLHLAS